MAIEKYSTLQPQKSPKRIIKGKLLTALGATGVLAPYPQNPEHILERKILLQAPFNPNPAPPPGPPVDSLLTGLQAYWKLDEAITGPFLDSTGNGHSLVSNVTGAANSVPCIINNGISNTGGGNGTSLWTADVAALAAGPGVDFSVSIWAANNSPAFPGTFICKSADIVDIPAGAGEFRLTNATAIDNTLHWFVWDSGAVMHDVGTAGVNDVNFHHYVLTFNSATNVAKSYFDGVFKVSITLTGNVPRTALPFDIGDANNSGRNAGGRMDEVGYWHAVLSDALVTRLYNGGAGLAFGLFT